MPCPVRAVLQKNMILIVSSVLYDSTNTPNTTLKKKHKNTEYEFLHILYQMETIAPWSKYMANRPQKAG